MGKLIFWLGVSVDGFFEGPDHDIGWHLVDDELHAYFNDEVRKLGAILEGRVTYELMADFWPTADQDPSNPAPVREFAGIWREKPKFVFSRTLENAEWNTTIVRDVVPEEIMRMKAEAGGDLVVGGANLAATFMRLDLIDEYRLYVHPVVVGAGSRLFPPDLKLDLTLEETRAFGNGVVMLRYRRG